MAARNRRRASRRSTLAEHGVISIRVRPGIEAVLVDLSPGGALVETEHRLRPGRRVELQLRDATGTSTVSGWVLRCNVDRVTASCVLYRGAVGFDDALSFPDTALDAAAGRGDRDGSVGYTWARTTHPDG